jgi:hypothetical protein
MPTLTAQRRKSIQKSVTEIVQLHEELLAELHKAVPNAEQKEDTEMPLRHARRPKHTRWRSAESAPSPSKRNLTTLGRRLRHSIDAGRPVNLSQAGLIVNTNTVMNVARVFTKFVGA